MITNQQVIHFAKELGFNLIGFSSAHKLEKETLQLNNWLNLGYQASMNYMERNIDKRMDVTNILPEAKSVITLALNYYYPDEHSNLAGNGKVSRYAWGKDYHLVIWDKLELLEEELKKLYPDFKCKSYVDTGPVMDKVWAANSGIGWMGKHSNIINREFGSWFFIANLITNCQFEYGKPIEDYCGSCTACLDACPTNAIVQPYLVDANKCISFLTIENKGEIAQEFKGRFNNWLFGCDICQDVCPWNKKFEQPTFERYFHPINKEFSLTEILELDEQSFKEKFEDSPIKRAKLSGLKRNAEFLHLEDEQ